MQPLAVMTGSKEGAVPISEAAQALLGGGLGVNVLRLSLPPRSMKSAGL
jgi:hypothetical protein